MNDKEFDPHRRTIPLEKRRGGGRPKPRPAGGVAKKWERPTEGNTPADRKSQKPTGKRKTMSDREFDPHERTVPFEKRRGGGRPLPRPAGGVAKKWEPPTGGTTPADRKKENVNREN